MNIFKQFRSVLFIAQLTSHLVFSVQNYTQALSRSHRSLRTVYLYRAYA